MGADFAVHLTWIGRHLQSGREALESIHSGNTTRPTHTPTLPSNREYGWLIVLTEVLVLVEQSIISCAAYFYAQAVCSGRRHESTGWLGQGCSSSPSAPLVTIILE